MQKERRGEGENMVKGTSTRTSKLCPDQRGGQSKRKGEGDKAIEHKQENWGKMKKPHVFETTTEELDGKAISCSRDLSGHVHTGRKKVA